MEKGVEVMVCPALGCIIFLTISYFMPSLGRTISDSIFKARLNSFNGVVTEIKNGMVTCQRPCGGDFEIVNIAKRPSGIRAIYLIQCADDGIGVLFLNSSDVPLLHTGYLFDSVKTGEDCSVSAPLLQHKRLFMRHIEGDWYHFSDQPGL